MSDIRPLNSVVDFQEKYLKCARVGCRALFDNNHHERRDLTCSHDLCKKCFEDVAGREEIEQKCSLCECVIPQQAVEEIADEHTTQLIREVNNVHASMQEIASKLSCTRCDDEENEAKTQCESCNQLLCANCTAEHAQESHKHRVEPITEVDKRRYKHRNCSTPGHHLNELTLFCVKKSCGFPICGDCYSDHKKHHVIPLSEALLHRKQHLKKYKDKYEEAMNHKDAQLRDNQGLRMKLHQNEKQAEQDITETVNKMKVALEEYKNKRLDEVRCIARDKDGVLNIQRANLELSLVQVSSLHDHLKSTIDRGSRLEIFNAYNRAVEMDSLTNLTQTRPMANDFVAFGGEKGLGAFQEALQEVGQVKNSATIPGMCEVTIGPALPYCKCYITVTTYDQDGNQTKELLELFEPSITDEYGNVQDFDVDCSEEGVYTIVFEPEYEGNYPLSIKILGHHIKGSPTDIPVEALQLVVKDVFIGEPLEAILHTSKTHSSCNNAYNADDILATVKSPRGSVLPCKVNKDGLRGFKVQSQNLRGIGEYQLDILVQGQIVSSIFKVKISHMILQGKESLGWISDVAFDSKGNLYVADTAENQTIKIYTDNFDFDSSISVTHQEVSFLAIDRDNNVVILYSKSKVIEGHASKPSQTVLRTFSLPEVDCPTAVGINTSLDDANGLIFVCDSLQHTIFLYSVDGTLQKKIGGYGHGDNNISSPRHLCIPAPDLLLVSDHGNRCVKLFDLNGVCLRIYSSSDEMKTTGAISATREGFLFVHLIEDNVIKVYDVDGSEEVQYCIPVESHSVFPSAEKMASMNGCVVKFDATNKCVKKYRFCPKQVDDCK